MWDIFYQLFGFGYLNFSEILFVRIQENGEINFKGGRNIMFCLSFEGRRGYNIDIYFQVLLYIFFFFIDVKYYFFCYN